VKGAAGIAPGTGIATFPSMRTAFRLYRLLVINAAVLCTKTDGRYQGHAAIYMGQNAAGIQVWDQWVGHPVSQRTIRWGGSGLSNNGNSFYVIDAGPAAAAKPKPATRALAQKAAQPRAKPKPKPKPKAKPKPAKSRRAPIGAAQRRG